jgi:hypothetical protein
MMRLSAGVCVAAAFLLAAVGDRVEACEASPHQASFDALRSAESQPPAASMRDAIFTPVDAAPFCPVAAESLKVAVAAAWPEAFACAAQDVTEKAAVR